MNKELQNNLIKILVLVDNQQNCLSFNSNPTAWAEKPDCLSQSLFFSIEMFFLISKLLQLIEVSNAEPTIVLSIEHVIEDRNLVFKKNATNCFSNTWIVLFLFFTCTGRSCWVLVFCCVELGVHKMQIVLLVFIPSYMLQRLASSFKAKCWRICKLLQLFF